jgi:protein tyrosine/serine phosphatase
MMGVVSADSVPRWLPLEGAVNARAVVPGVLLRSDNLQRLTANDVRLIVDQQRVEVVLDLRTDVEVMQEGPGPMTHEDGVRIEHRSLYPDSGGNTDVELDNSGLWLSPSDDEFSDERPAVRAYLNYLRRRPDSVVESVRTIARAQRGVLVHCAAGKDRTGVVVALALDAAGIDREVIIADYLASRQRIHRIFDRLLSSPTYRGELEGQRADGLAPAPGTMERFLELVDQRLGGPAAWLTANGLERADLERLQRRLAAADPSAAAA